MKLAIVYFVFCLSPFAFSSENNIRKDSDYLRFESKLTNTTLNFPELKIFGNSNFSGKPVIEFNEKGLFIEGKIVCILNKEHPSLFKSVKSKDLPCKDYLPIHSDYFDSIGPETFLVVYIEGPGSSQYYESKFKGKKLYIDKSRLGDFKYNQSQEKEKQSKLNEDKLKLHQTLKEDPSLGEYIKDLNICFSNKDKSCLQSKKADFNKLFDELLEEICVPGHGDSSYHPSNDKYGKHCPSLESFGFNSNGERIVLSDSSRSYEKTPEDKEKLKQMIDVLWQHYQNCFHSENPYSYQGKVNAVNNKKLQAVVEIFENNKGTISCSLNKVSDGKDGFVWTLLSPN